MGMKNSLGIMSIMALAMAGESFTHEDKTSTEKVLKKRPIKLIIHKGLKPFYYDENIVYAINKKVADKKAIKKGYLKL